MSNPREGSIYHRYLDEDLEITCYRMLYNFRVCLGTTGDFGCIEDAYCYADGITALTAAALWDGKAPILDGWHKNPITGVRRPGGDPAKETRDE